MRHPGFQSAPRDDDAALLARVRARVLATIRTHAAPKETVRAGQGGWEVLSPGVERKLLARDGDSECALVRLAPGASVAAHLHAMGEECLVLEGSFTIAPDLVLCAGDFHVARKGSAHGAVHSEAGALLYLRTCA
ncbi:cupin domain-containing protein [Ramlibacter sp. XY19]|uniref:cupin domain-containing protein n=1 Tax=Ramlibacter paludis TaxID=2908000 RepID=UPI0023DBF542|nr:cupin domain-containing protein [Ramlibacter paludis]MCG2594611.1 cupin domain-containing protein [Ramlibacter paludis]